MYVFNEYMEFGVDTPHIATYNFKFKLVFHLLFSTIYSTVAIKSIRHLVWPVTCLTKLWFRQITIFGNYDGDL